MADVADPATMPTATAPLKSVRISAAFRVSPERVVFERAETSVVAVTIRNASAQTRHIRVMRPVSKRFTIVNHNEIPVRIASGLSSVIRIRQNPECDDADSTRDSPAVAAGELHDGNEGDTMPLVSSGDVFDEIAVITDVGKIVIPLRIRHSSSCVTMADAIDLGQIIVGNTATYVLPLKNVGKSEARFEAVDVGDGEDAFKVSPRSGIVPGNGGVAHVRIELEARQIGSVRRFLRWRLDDRDHRLDVSGEFVASSLDVIDADHGKATLSIDFGRVYYGTRSECLRRLFNNSPNACTFRVVLRDTSGISISTPPSGEPESEAADAGPPVSSPTTSMQQTAAPPALFVSPEEGVLSPYSSLPIKFRFRPRQADLQKGFASQIPEGAFTSYHVEVRIEAVDEERSVKVDLRGLAMAPLFSLSRSDMNFGSCPVRERRDTMVKIENRSADLPLPFTISRIPQFHCDPSKGTIPPLQARDVIVSFQPHQLGVFRGMLQLTVGVSRTVQFPVMGMSTEIGVHQAPSKSRRFIEPSPCPAFDDDEACLAALQRTKQALPSKDIGNPVVQFDDEYTFSTGQLIALKEQRDRYQRFLRTEAERRQSRRAVTCDDDFANSLPEPVIPLPRNREPLWLQYPMAGYAGWVANDPSGGASTASEAAVKDKVGKRFKSVPSTQAEVQDCSLKLSSRRLAKITFGPATIAFGTVCTESRTKRAFVVVNNLEEYIHVALTIDPDGPLRHTSPQAQVIPPGETAAFVICLTPEHVQDLRLVVPYTVNSAHVLNFTVTAQVTPMDLTMSTNLLQFTFAHDSLEFTTARRLILSNPCGAPARFSWVVPDPTLSFVPQSGTVAPHKDFDVHILYRPAIERALNAQCTLQIVGGPDKHLICTSDAISARCSLSPATVDVGTVAVGVQTTTTTSIVNHGQHQAVFAVGPCPAEIIVQPQKGKIPPGQSLPLRIETCLSTPATVHEVIQIDVRGCPSIPLSIRCSAVLPTVSVIQDEIDFGSVTLSGRVTVDVSIVSTSPVTATVYLDLSAPLYNELRVSGPPAALMPASDSSPIGYISKYDLQRALVSSKDIAVGTSSASNGIEGPRIFRLTIAPGATVQFTLMFSPIVVGEHTIPLPLILAGMPSSYQGIRRMIHAQGLKPKVVLSSSTISFGERIVLRSGKTRSGGYTSSFTITNDDLSQVQWSLVGDNDPVADPIWRVEPAQGLLMKGDSSTVKVTFVPTTSGSFEKVLSLYLGANRAEPYMQVVLRGSAEHPMLKFDTIEMVLPVVPLGVRSEMRVVISNSGYDRVTVGYHLPKDTVHIPLEVGFPEGNTLGNERQSIPVVVTFLADRPTAFAAAIDFTDGDGNRFPLPVAGVSDNSVLSCWSFLSRRRYSLRSVEGHAITCVDLGPRAPAPVSAGLISSENIRPASEVTAAASILLRFLAAQNLLDLSVDGFPAELVSSGGEQVVRLVEFLSGRKLGKRDAQGDADLTARYDALLACLRSNGALLTTKAEHLGTSSVMLASTPFGSWERQALEKLYPSVSRLAWLDVLAQIVKVFLLGRVTAKTVGGPTIADRATTSNIFSPPECLLLAWLEHHCASRFPAAKRSVRNFDSDLRDGVVLAALMFTYQPHLKQLASVSLDADGDEQKMLSNVQKVVSAMEESNLEFLLTPPAILSPNPRDMLLFVLYLFFTLPGFTPQSRVEFKGIVQKDILKNVVLRNPTASEIAYDVRLVGCPDFQVAAKSVVLGPRASESVAISFRGRFTREDAARLWFTPRRQLADRPPKALVRPMIFDLVSAVTASPTPHASLTVRAKLYDSMQVAVDVTNPFDRDCTFVVDATRQSVARNGPRLKNASASTPTVPPVVFPNAFAFDRKSVTVKKGATERLLGTFKPLCDGAHACQVNLCDDKVGELRIEVTGYVDGPNPFGDVLRVTCKENTSVVKEVPLTCANPLLERARPLPSSTKSSAKDEPKSAEFLPMPLTYACESSSPYAIVPRTITLSEKPSGSRAAKPKEGAAPSNEPGHQDDNVLRVTFRGGQPGTYPVEVTLRSELDVRVLQLEFLVQSEGMRAALEFEVAAGQLVRQLVPIVNNSDNEWRLTAEITGPGWSGPPAITVPKRSTGEYPLDFRPQWICQVEGALVLTNATNKQTYTFQLKGVSKEPLPVRFVQIKCNARESSEHTFTVENGGNDDVEYRVESDLPYVGGDSTLKVPARSRRDYRLVLTPQLGGQFSGSLTFVTADGQYQWFAVDVTASRPAAESTVSISAPLRQAATAELELSNPLGTPMSFDVRIEGDYLDGPDRLSLAPSSSATYALVYAPLRTGPASGSVHFVNPTIGEFWYELDLSCLEPEPVRLALLECEAGSQAVAKVTLANPTDEAVEVVPVSSQPKNFSVRPTHIQLPASGAFVAQIVYTPSTLNEVQSAEVRFSSGIAGDWVFHVSGVGLPPTALPPIRLVSPVRQRLSSLVQFRNPFDDPMRVHVSLVEDGTSNFHLFMKRTTARVAGQATLQIPFFYKPNDLARTTAQIVVEASSGLRWMYPLVGEADIHSADRQQFTCPARATLSKAITLGLPGVTEADIDRDTFTTDLRFVDCTPNDIAQATLSQSFSVGARAARPHLTPQGPVLQFDVAMTPLRSMTANALLVVSKSSGCQWTFDVRFVVSEPDVDDVIRITADLNQVGNVSFRLTNVASEPAPFQAAFSSDAPCQLSVHPTSGVLAPRDSLGTLFIVSFAPTAYGKVVVGRLQIRTADMEWAYEVRGSHPHYAPPRGRHTFSSFIDEATMKRLQSANSARAKNFLSDNIRAASSRRKPAPPGTARSRRL